MLVKKKAIALAAGKPLTGISWTGEFPKVDYEISLEAMRIEGDDIFCGIAFPVGASRLTLYVGQAAGDDSLVCLDQVDGRHSRDNVTTTRMRFTRGRWYGVRLRVTRARIQVWIDKKEVIDLPTAGHSFKIGYFEGLGTFGIGTWRASGAVRDIRLRRLGDGATKRTVGAIPGKTLVVRKDGRGDFTSIQKAMDVAAPHGVVEIQDDGPYREAVVIPEGKDGITLRGGKGAWPVITSQGMAAPPKVQITVAGRGASLERLVVVNLRRGKDDRCFDIGGADCRLRSVISHSNAPYPAMVWHGGTGCRIENCVFTHEVNIYHKVVVRDCLWLRQGLHSGHRDGAWDVENSVCQWAYLHEATALRRCTIVDELRLSGNFDYAAQDSIIGRIVLRDAGPRLRLERCDVFGDTPFTGMRRPRKGCITVDPQFRNPSGFDYRLKPTSPCRRKASDSGDLGCRYTSDMVEVLKQALELRKQSVIEF